MSSGGRRSPAAVSAAPAVERSSPPLSLRTLLRGFRGYSAANLVTPAVSLATVGLFSRIFTPAEYGRYTIMLSGATIATTLGAEWLGQALNRFLPGETVSEIVHRQKGAVSAAVSTLALGTLALGLLTWLVLRLIGATVWLELLAPAVLVAVAGIVFRPAGVVLQAELRASAFAGFRVGQALTRFALSAALVFTFYRHPAALLWGAGAGLAGAAALAWRVAGLPAPTLHLASALPTLREFAAYGLPMVGWFLTGMLLYHADRYMILALRGPGEVGIYGVTYDLVVGGAAVVASPLLLAAHPFLMGSWRAGDRQATALWLGAATEWAVILGVVSTAGLVVFSREIASIFLGGPFRTGYRVMPVIFAGVTVWQIGMLVHKPLEFAKRTRAMLLAALSAATVNIALNLALIPAFGYVAAAWTTLASYSLYVAVTAWMGRGELSWSVNPMPLLLLSIAAVAGVISATAVRRSLAPVHGEWLAHGVQALLLLPMVTLGAWLAWRGTRRLGEARPR